MSVLRPQRAGSVPGVVVTAATPGTSCRVRILVAVAAILASLTATAGRAHATWIAPVGAGSASASARTVPAVAAPLASNVASGARVTVTWPATVFAGGAPVDGYLVHVSDAGTGETRPAAGGCAGRIAATSCEETVAPDGRWRYRVSAVHGDLWEGATGAPSGTVAVDTTGPTVVAIAAGDGDGKIEHNDFLRLTFSEPLDPATVPPATTFSITNVNGVETLNLAGVTEGAVATGSGGLAAKNQTTVWASAVALSAGNTVLTVTITAFGGIWVGSGSGSGVVRFVPAGTLKDVAGNPAGGLRAQLVQLC